MNFPNGPFVMFEDASAADGEVRVFTHPRAVVAARRAGEIETALERLRAAQRNGAHAAGWLSYEAGRALEARLTDRVLRHPSHDFPLLWFGLFERMEVISRDALTRALPDPKGAWISRPRPRVSRQGFVEAFARVKAYIEAGDIYQVNLSYRADVDVLGDPMAAYSRLRTAGAGGWSGVVHDGARWLVSTSPELFFRLSPDGRIEARPMKGTAPRGTDPQADQAARERLCNDPKERAENVMIVDLLRNDISRIAARGSVHVPQLLTLETYPTLHTLTSTIRAEIKQGGDVVDVIKALFPCGSITGAPKIRAMEIIEELEGDCRGPYAGSIGWIAPDGGAEFNVAIRTLALSGERAELGLGAAVVYDSTPDREWDECQTKGRFLDVGPGDFGLIETMRFTPEKGVELLDRHLARLRASAARLGFAYDEARLRAEIGAAVGDVGEARVVRLVLGQDGKAEITSAAPASFAALPVIAALAPLPVDARDFRLRFKTTSRDFYDRARAASGAHEVVFVDAQGFLTEGSFTNLFVARDGVLVTPPVRRGLLAGVLRASLLASGAAQEGDLRACDLAQGFFLGNAVRGLVPAKLAPNP